MCELPFPGTDRINGARIVTEAAYRLKDGLQDGLQKVNVHFDAIVKKESFATPAFCAIAITCATRP
ncbi:MAG: hypothetical protein Fur0026_01380 [Sideroxydans sp.]